MAFVSVASSFGGMGMSLAGAYMQSNAAKDAAQKQADAAREANALQYQMYQQQRQDQEPWRQAGAGALSQLGNSDFQKDFSSADFQQDPGYQFRMQQGMDALQRSAAARGGLMSGGTMKSLADYSQNSASQEYQNAYNRFNADRDRRFSRLSSVAGLGQTANGAMGAAGMNYANTVGNNMTNLGNAQGAAGIASANAWAGGLAGVGKAGMDYAAMNQQNNWMKQWQANQGGGSGFKGSSPTAGESYMSSSGLV